MKCPKHKKDYQKVCTTCDKTPVCSECIDEGHSKHSVSLATSIAKEEKTRLSQLTTSNDKTISQLSSEKKKTEDQIKHRKRTCNDDEKEINFQRKRLHDLVDEVANDMIGLYKSASKIDMESLESQLKSISDSLSTAEKYRSSVKTLMTEKDDFAVIQRAKDVKAIPQYSETSKIDMVTFKRRNVTKALVRSMFEWGGRDFESDDTENNQPLFAPATPKGIAKVSSFEDNDQGVTFIRPSQQFHILKETRSTQLVFKCVDKNGNSQWLKSFDTMVTGYASTQDDRLLVCCYKNREIVEATLTNVRPVVNLSPLYPMDIGATRTGKYIVTMRDDNTFTTTSESVRGVIVFNKDWKEVRRVLKDDHGNNLFVRPYKVSISNSGTIVILNMMSDTHCHLVVLKPDFSLKFRVIGQGKVIPGDERMPEQPAYDKYDINDAVFYNEHIVLYEGYSRCVQLLDEQGNVVKLLSKLETPVWSLSVDKEGQLWTGNKKGQVIVYKFQ